MKIRSIKARRIFDSRGKPTIEVNINGSKGAAPSGTSVGAYEAPVIGVDKGVKIVNTVLKSLKGQKLDQEEIDKKLVKIGSNTSIAVSFALYNALHKKRERYIFPYPLGNVFGGGRHKGYTDIQEILVLPIKAKTFPNAVKLSSKVYNELKKKLRKRYGKLKTNYEGALVARTSDLKALDMIADICEELDVKIGMDMAASCLWKANRYNYKTLKKKLDSGDQIDFVRDLIKTYHLYYVEDPFHQDDFKGFAELKKKARGCLICADDLTATNVNRLKKAVYFNSINSIIIKPNQVGTVTLTKQTVDLAKKNRLTTVISHRSGETKDFTISHLALDWGIPIIKAGIVDVRPDKLNELMRLWKRAKKPKMVGL